MNIEDVFQEVLRIVSASCPGKEPKVLANGVRLFCHQPEIAPLAWLHVVFAPLDCGTIEATEQRLNTQLPEDYKSFLQQTNGLMLFSYKVSVWGVRTTMIQRVGDDAWAPHDIVDHNLPHERPDKSPSEVLFFAAADDGDNWCFFEFSNQGYRIGKTERHHFNPVSYWPSFETWLFSEIESLQRDYTSGSRSGIA